MTNADVVSLLLAKAVCCGLLVLGAAGTLSGLLASLTGLGLWLVGAALIVAIGGVVWRSMPRFQARGASAAQIEEVDNALGWTDRFDCASDTGGNGVAGPR